MFSMCSELTPRACIPDTRIPQLMQPCIYLVLPALPVTQLISRCANDPDHPKWPAFCRSGINMLQIIWMIQKRQSAAKSGMAVFLRMIQIIQSSGPFAKKTDWYKDVANDLDKLVCCKVGSS